MGRCADHQVLLRRDVLLIPCVLVEQLDFVVQLALKVAHPIDDLFERSTYGTESHNRRATGNVTLASSKRGKKNNWQKKRATRALAYLPSYTTYNNWLPVWGCIWLCHRADREAPGFSIFCGFLWIFVAQVQKTGWRSVKIIKRLLGLLQQFPLREDPDI